jgi:hypothetical protein
MPSFISQSSIAVAQSANVEIRNNIKFLDEVLGGLKVFTLMLSKMQPIPDSVPKLAEAEFSVKDIVLGAAVIIRLYYNHEFGTPPLFQYDEEKLAYLYEKYDLIWNEPVPRPTTIYVPPEPTIIVSGTPLPV